MGWGRDTIIPVLVASTVGLWPRVSSAGGTLEVEKWLSKSGVTLLAVDFYASWCGPCKKALPRWKALQERYAKDGLRVVVVAVKDPKSGCGVPGLSPDDIVCDDEGKLLERFVGAETLPAAFLWSWQGELLVSRGHVEDVEREVGRRVAQTPVLAVDVQEVAGGGGLAPGQVWNLIRQELQRRSKLQVALTKKEQQALLALRERAKGEGEQCREGQAMTPSSILQVSIKKPGPRHRLQLGLLSADRGCLVAGTVVDWQPDRAEASVAEGVDELFQELSAEVRYPWGAEERQVVGGRGRPPPLPEVREDGPRVTSGGVRSATGDLTVAAKPAKTVRLELVDPTGEAFASASPYKNDRAAPGRWKVTAKAPGHQPQTVEIVVPVDEVVLESIELLELGGLTIAGTPAGAAVEVSGPGGFANTGGLPWEASGLGPGEYRVRIRREGYEGLDQTTRVEPGKTARVEVSLEKVAAAVPRAAGEAKGRSGVTWVYSAAARVHLAKSETTVGQYRACVEAGGCERDTMGSGAYCNYGAGDRSGHPMNCVNWHGADQFCRWAGGRLPTEEEWAAEASSGGTRAYPWGEAEATCARAVMDEGGAGCGRDSTWPVCSKPAGNSVSGLCDMSGNVWEWTSSSEGSSRVLRGGSWFGGLLVSLRASARLWLGPGVRNDLDGFRCAAVSPQ